MSFTETSLSSHSLLAPIALSGLLACGLSACALDSELDNQWPDSDMELGQSADELQNGTNTTGYAPVVRIEYSNNGTTYYCSATAISDDTLVTAVHCLKTGTNTHNWIKIKKAHGANASAEGAKSSYFILSRDMNDNYASDGTLSHSEIRKDIAFVKFGRDTFSSYYSLGTANALSTGNTVRLLGFGGNNTKAYGDDTVTGFSWQNSQQQGYIATAQNGGPDLEDGDSGGPTLHYSGGSYKVVGVNSAAGSGNGYHTAVTQALHDYITPVLDDLPVYCLEGFQSANYTNHSWGFCITQSIQSNLDNTSFSDPFLIRARHGGWGNELSSLHLADDMIVTLYDKGDLSGDRVTFQTVFNFGDAPAVSALGDYSFNNKASSMRYQRDTSPDDEQWNLVLTRHGKCVDLTSGNTSNGTNIQQWSCQNNPNMMFRLVEAGGGYYQIKHASSGKCLDVSGYGTSNGSNIHLWSCHGGDNQLFSMASNTSTADITDFTIRGKQSGKCLDLSSGNSSNGTNIQIWSCNSSNANQNFSLKQY